jgi:hypothetical protein
MAAHFQRADDPAFAAARKNLEKEAEQKLGEMTTKAVANELGSFADRNVPFVNQAPPLDSLSANALLGEYTLLFRERYVDLNGDVSKAKEQTVERLKTLWRPSIVNGGALMRHAPEQHYPQVNGSHDWMKRDIEATIAQARLGADDEYDPAFGTGPSFTYKVLSDPQTDADVAARRPPSYAVMVRDTQSGRENLLIGWDGKPKRIVLDPANAQREAREAFMTTRERDAANEPILQSSVAGAP